ncbi:C-type mannose receptor 2-like isoform X1 [Anguilla anguilla]|uniref:C-type mannose receptor 2-like isoform X1 n=2 Tax=Anguilla anguilla TaxID=7936 RepID=UPI0015AE3120|nr:C-type mannose receptor 2-like isoform X1 [Anguilla anguilla]
MKNRASVFPYLSVLAMKNRASVFPILIIVVMKNTASMFPVLIIIGLCSLISGLSPQYHFVIDQKNWTEAQKYCREKYSDLVTIYDRDDIGSITEAVRSGFTGRAWIGLERGDLFKWHWSLADREFYSDREFDFRNWKQGEPNIDRNESECAAMYHTGEWFDDDCNNKKHFICIKGRRNDNKGFILLRQRKTWREAQTFCRQNHEDLVSVRNQSENQEILNVLQSESAWIGLFSDPWKWSDHSNSSFRFWRSKQPNNFGGNQNCVAAVLDNSGEWNDFQCKRSRPFFCQGRMKSKTPLPTIESATHSDKTTNQASKHTPQKSTTEPRTTERETTQFEKYITTTGPIDKQTSVTTYKYTERSTTEESIIERSAGDYLILLQENKTWSEALHYCREHHVNLVSVTTAATQNWVARKAENASTAHVWLGLRFTCAFKFWFWVRSEPGCYQNWAHGHEPAGMEVCGHAGAVESGGEHHWVSLPETERLNFICYTCDRQGH